MVDKAVGTAGTLRITDDGTTVRYYVLCSDPSTNVGTYRYAINGATFTTTLPSGFGSKLLASRTYSKTGTATLSQQATGTQGLGGAASLSVTITRAAPAAPSALSIARVSDSQQTLTWTRNATYTSVVVQRRTNSGAWQQVGIASGNAYTFTDKTTQGARLYEYRVAGVAASGQSAWSGATAVYTSPSAPTGVKATRSGGDIVVSAATLPPYYTNFDVRDGATVIATSVGLPYTHVAPNAAVAHTYTVRAHINLNNIYSAWSSASNTVQLVTRPNAPTGLVPNGAVRTSDEDVVLSWTYNAVDSSPQSAFEVQYRVDGGAWTTLTGTTASQVAVPFGIAAVDWQVRTKGAHPDWSDWSAVASFTVIDRPGVAVVQPAGTWDASVLIAEWTWFQPQGRPQSAWMFELLDSSNQVVESRNGSGATGFIQANTRLTEGMWTVRVQAATGDVWSLWATETFEVAFTPPGEPAISGFWDETQGGVQLSVSGEEYGGAVLSGGAWQAELGA